MQVATLDYGHEVGGIPWFEVSSLTGPAQLELKYSEEYRGLEAPFSDGPFLYGNQVGANFRQETLNITETGYNRVFLVQGGQRWESIRLLTNGSISFSQVGFEATFPNVNPEEEPGQFSSDDAKLNAIWKLGVRASEASCIELGTQPAIWRVDSKKGALIESLRPIQSDKAPYIGNSTLEFQANIEREGLWWGMVCVRRCNSLQSLTLFCDYRPGALVAVEVLGCRSPATYLRTQRSSITTTHCPLATHFK